MKKSILLLFITTFLIFCTQYPIKQSNVITKKNITELHLVPKTNTLEQQPTTIESEEIHDPDPPRSNNPSNNENSQFKENPTQCVCFKYEIDTRRGHFTCNNCLTSWMLVL